MEKQYYVIRSDMTLRHASYAPKQKNDHKYVARIQVGTGKNGNPSYRYFYTMEEWQAYQNGKKRLDERKNDLKEAKKIADEKVTTAMKNGDAEVKGLKDKVSKFFSNIASKLEIEVPKKIDTAVNKVYDAVDKFRDDKDNMFDVTSDNYSEKIKKIAESDEWKAIVKSGDPEYVKKNSDGTTTYLIDDYVSKKKHPIVDILDDIANCRKVTINKLDKNAVVSGVKEQVMSYFAIGAMAVGVVSKALLVKSKLYQGSYDDEIEEMAQTVENGAKYAKEMVDTSSELANSVDRESVKRIVDSTKREIQVSEKKKISDTSLGQKIDGDKVMEVANILMSSGEMPPNAGAVLSSLTEEELRMVNVIVNRAANG